MLKAMASLLDICVLPAGQIENCKLKIDNYFIQIIIYDLSNHVPCYCIRLVVLLIQSVVYKNFDF